jgi:flagellin
MAGQFDSLLTQIDTLVDDSSFGGSDLIQGASDNLTVTFNENSTSTLTTFAIDSPSGTAGINIAAAGNNFLNDSDIITALTAVGNAVTTLRTTSTTLASNAKPLRTGLQFAQELANMNNGGAGKQTLADLNAENANFKPCKPHNSSASTRCPRQCQRER